MRKNFLGRSFLELIDYITNVTQILLKGDALRVKGDASVFILL